ncbi:MAG TPA: hypothetical protein VNN80_28465 [Polyangiaceae bacterium]|jgi:hypothetical protein|nr:hypothetical protein [Polyangiaceae bacterium]
MLPIVAVQVAPADAAPTLADHLLRACSAGLSRARCVPARGLEGETPHGVAIVSWAGAEHVSIEVGLAGAAGGAWVSRALDFAATDPETERWRAVGFTIALLADDPRFWPEPTPAPEPDSVLAEPALTEPPEGAAERGAGRYAVSTELRALAGTGLVSGPWRWGAELRLAVPLSGPVFLTGSLDYALAQSAGLEVRWFDVTFGAGLLATSVLPGLDARARLELLGENVAARVERGAAADRRSAWVPGVSLGGDLLYPLGEGWQLSARGDAFWLDGSTGITSTGQRIGATAGAGVLVGLGAGHRF